MISQDPAGRERSIIVDRIIAATGYRPDHSIAGEPRLSLDPIVTTPALAALTDLDQHSRGTLPPHGDDEPTHPETGACSTNLAPVGPAAGIKGDLISRPLATVSADSGGCCG